MAENNINILLIYFKFVNMFMKKKIILEYFHIISFNEQDN